MEGLECRVSFHFDLDFATSKGMLKSFIWGGHWSSQFPVKKREFRLFTSQASLNTYVSQVVETDFWLDMQPVIQNPQDIDCKKTKN